MSINVIILIVIGFVAVAFLYDAARKSRKEREKRMAGAPQAQRMITANEAGPTETGRYRVQEVLRTTDKPEEEDIAAPTAKTVRENPEASRTEDSSLPDPFDEKNVKPSTE